MELIYWLISLLLLTILGIIFRSMLLGLFQMFLSFCGKVYQRVTPRIVKALQAVTVLIFISYCAALFGANMTEPENNIIILIGRVIVIILLLTIIFWVIFGIGLLFVRKTKKEVG